MINKLGHFLRCGKKGGRKEGGVKFINKCRELK